MSKKLKDAIAKAEEIARREADLTAVYDAENLAKLEDRMPEAVDRIRGLIDIGRTPKMIGHAIRRDNSHMWPESKIAESVARALIDEDDR